MNVVPLQAVACKAAYVIGKIRKNEQVFDVGSSHDGCHESGGSDGTLR